MNEDQIKNDGCYQCGFRQPILRSKTVGTVDRKGIGLETSVALCDTCFPITLVVGPASPRSI